MNNTNNHELRAYRKRSPFTIEDIVGLTGMKDISHVSRQETNDCSAQMELALLYHHLFRVPIPDLFPRQNRAMLSRMRLRIPNIIDELRFLGTDEAERKMKYLEEVLVSLPNE